ncbi:hypothetical protein ACFVUW_15695 [Streptomyces xiamenensis]|uniref:hypothetical protein n=1 Tax=Streptomyces xiamenensis TaxID=408015 RepID=UPI0036EC8557
MSESVVPEGPQSPHGAQPSPEPPSLTEIKNNEVGGDVIAGHHVTVTKYITQLAHLQPHGVSRCGILPRAVFERPAEFEDALKYLAPDGEETPAAGVLVLVTEPESGARTTALRLLDESLPEGLEIFELLPDWDAPDVSRIPSEKHCGYLLNLSTQSNTLDDDFRNQLSEYATVARDQGTLLIVLTTSRGWGSVIVGKSLPAPPLVAMRISRPSAAGITERWLRTRHGTTERIAWLHDADSLFANLLSPMTVPGAAVRLAEVISNAEHRHDKQALDRYQGWGEQLGRWFGGSEDAWVPKRALYIATAFLERAPSRVVLDSTDLLLGTEDVGWPPEKGGVLAGPDARTRCGEAGISFLDDGTISVNDKYPGMAQALLRHVWRTRPQLVPVLIRWLEQISAPNSSAAHHLGRLAAALTALAESEGVGVVLDRVEQWVKEGCQRRLAVRVLDDLAVHPRIGASVRDRLRGWSQAPTIPGRQGAVAEICRGKLGTEYTQVALNRLRKILDSSPEAGPRTEALKSLTHLLTHPVSMAPTLAAITDWAAIPSASGAAFVHLLSPASEDGTATDRTLVHSLLTQEGEKGTAILTLLRSGWRSTWRNPEARRTAAAALDGWCSVVEAGSLPQEPFEQVVSVVLDEESDNALNSDLQRIISGGGPVRSALLSSYVHRVRESARRSGTPSSTPEPELIP